MMLCGISFSSFMSIYPGFNVDQFGAKHNSVNYGIMFFGYGIAGLISPVLTSYIFGTLGSYDMAFVVAGCFVIFGLLMTIVFRKFKSKESLKEHE